MRERKLDPVEVRDLLRGRTVVDADLEENEEDFPQGNNLRLRFDNGATVIVSGWGMDAFGTDVYYSA